MGTFSQDNRPLAVQTPLDKDVLLLEGFRGTEAVSRLFHFELDLLAEEPSAVAFDKLLGQPVTVRLNLPVGGRRYFNGIVSRLVQGMPVLGSKQGASPLYRYRAEVVPQLWLFTRRVRSRIFQHKSVPDILRLVFAGLDVDYSGIQGTFKPREFCAQYRESDFAFASRLMEDDGIYYFFTHTESAHRLVLGNTPGAHPDVPGPTEARLEINQPDPEQAPRVFAWEMAQELRSGKYTVWDYSFEMPGKNLGFTQATQPKAKVGSATHALEVGGNDQLEIYDSPAEFAQRFDGVGANGNDQAGDLAELFKENRRVAGIRMGEEAAQALTVSGESSCRNFTAGHKFTLAGHPAQGDGAYILTEVEHTASLEGAYTEARAEVLRYRNRFGGLPDDLPYRPRRTTPRPKVTGLQTAIVVGPTGQDVFCDKYGRVKVQFLWDRQGATGLKAQDGDSVVPMQYWPGPGQATPTSSCWVRVNQAWAGRGFGGIFIPRLGQEVTVAFLEGDPDQPLILGGLYNAANLPPFTLPDYALISGMKSSTAGGDQGKFSGLHFEDTPGKERVSLQSEGDSVWNTEGRGVQNYGQAHRLNVGRHRFTTVGSIPGLGGSGGGGAAAASGPLSPSTWSVNGVRGEFGTDISTIFGIYCSAIAGLNSSFVVGNKLDLLINPLSALLSGPWGAALSPIMGQLAGRNEFIIGPKTEYVFNRKGSLIMGGKEDVTLQPWEQPTFRLMVKALAVMGTLEMAALGVAAGIVGKDWATQSNLWDWSKPSAVVSTSLMLGGISVIALATAVFGTASYLALGSKTIKAQVQAMKDAIANHNNPPVIVPANPNRTEVIGGAYTGTFATGHSVTTGGTLQAHATMPVTIPPVPAVADCHLTMDPVIPVNGVQISTDFIGVTPKVQLNATGVTITAGLSPAAEGKIVVGPTGISLTFGAAPAQSAINLGPTGISLSFGPPGAGQSITLNTAGVTIKSGAMTKGTFFSGGVNLTGLGFMFSCQGSYMLSAKALFENISGLVTRSESMHLFS